MPAWVRGRAFLVLAAALLVPAGCAAPGAEPDDGDVAATEEQPGDQLEDHVADPPEGPAAVTCDPQQPVPIQGGEHLIGDADPPVPYNSTPPTSGWHASGAFEVAVHGEDDPLSEPRQVSVLEAGGVVVTYHALDDEDRAALEALVRERYDGLVSLTPYGEIPPGTVAMTAWGILQRCDGLDLDAVVAFIEAHADPEPHTPGHG